MLNMNRGRLFGAVSVTSLAGLVFNAGSLPEDLEQIIQTIENFPLDQRFVVFFGHEFEARLVDAQLASLMQLVEPLDLGARIFGIANQDATWKSVTIKNVSSMPESFSNHKR